MYQRIRSRAIVPVSYDRTCIYKLSRKTLSNLRMAKGPPGPRVSRPTGVPVAIPAHGCSGRHPGHHASRRSFRLTGALAGLPSYLVSRRPYLSVGRDGWPIRVSIIPVFAYWVLSRREGRGLPPSCSCNPCTSAWLSRALPSLPDPSIPPRSMQPSRDHAAIPGLCIPRNHAAIPGSCSHPGLAWEFRLLMKGRHCPFGPARPGRRQVR
jgi:hypothetical protein